VRKLAQNHSIGTKFKFDRLLITIHSHTKNQVNFSNHSEKKVVTTKYLAKLQSGETFASLLNIHSGDIRVVPTHLVFVYCNPIWPPCYLQLPMQSVHIITNVVSSNPSHGEVHSVQHFVIIFVSDHELFLKSRLFTNNCFNFYIIMLCSRRLWKCHCL
jgi:hypothetical protein